MNIETSYCSNFISGNTSKGALVGVIEGFQNVSWAQFYFNNQSNPLTSCSNFNFNDSSVSCGKLYNQVLLFNNSIWDGDNLRSEFQPVAGVCQCCSSTTPPSTNIPSTIIPSTVIPSTAIPTTVTPSTNFPSTLSATTFIPSTETPSTLIPTNISCIYQVENCSNCVNTNTIIQDTTGLVVQCLSFSGKWSYTFKNSTSNQIYLNENNTVVDEIIYIEGDIVVPSGNVVIFPVTKDKNSFIQVNGCLRIEGKINVSLSEQPQSGVTTIVLIKYNCTEKKRELSQTSTFKRVDNSQIIVSTNYQKSNCDKISSNVLQGQQTLSVSLSTSINGKCKSKNYFPNSFFFFNFFFPIKSEFPAGAIIGIVLGVIFVTTIIIISIFIYYKRIDYKFDKSLEKLEEEMNPKKKWEENKGHKNKTEWKDFNTTKTNLDI